jgi:hypothetical protein
MKAHRSIRSIFATQAALLVLILLACTPLLRAADYQWSVTIDPTIPDLKNPWHPRAFLWIPPTCGRVRAVVLAEHNMLEEGIFEDITFRRTMSELGFAIAWISPSFDPVFRFDKGAGDRIEKLMRDLAAESGYRELEYAPIVPLGHSAHASFPWNFAAWNPARTLAILSIHGDAPLTNLTGSGRPNPDWGNRTIDGVPGLMVMGEYEWSQKRLDPAITFHKLHPGAPLSVLADVGHGHFDHSPQMIDYLCLFLRKAALQRLPEWVSSDGPVALKPIDPRQGWLIDQWRCGQPPQARAAPYADYKGDRDQAFWCFDQEIAFATENFNHQQGRLPQLLGFEQGGQFIPQNPKTHQQVSLNFEPDADGVTFHLKGVFIDAVPDGNPTQWTGLSAGSAIGHARGGGPVMVSRIEGAVAQTGPYDWAVNFSRGSDVTDSFKRTDELWFVATQDGDSQFKSAVQQAELILPMRNTEGAEQHISFPEIKSQTNLTQFLTLNATSDAGVPVSYYVREGPAEIEGNVLKFTPIPPRAKYPIKVTVVAWQYGRSVNPKLQSAYPVARTFSITM